jgi:hypothetical protein
MLSEEALRAKAQRALIEIFHTELGLGSASAQSALLAKTSGHMEDYVKAKQRAVKAADVVWHFMGRVTDDVIRTDIGKKLAELDRFISIL